MANIIHLLPDAVANQIAAGEVIQRPASVIKELVENSIDAGATDVKVVVKDAGRTLIQVIDNGCGMTETDARLAFERHATSKISDVTDLYSLHTMGFRGEALASIAAVAQVELLTRRAEDELGVKIEIAGSKVISQEPTVTPVGSQFCVKNLFFNIPARRAFLKSDNAEMRHVTQEFLRVALAHPDVALSLTSNGTPLYTLMQGNMKQRVSAVVGRALSQELLPIEVETDMVTIRGFVGTPETARKTSNDQFFFANDRYMRNPYFHKAVMDAYKNIIAADQNPAYFIYMNVDPRSLDVNVHPQKTEIKFEDDTAIWQILNASVRECLGKYNIMPSLDFDTADPIDIPTYQPNKSIDIREIPPMMPESGIPYNPFEHENNSRVSSGGSSLWSGGGSHKQSVEGWETLYSRMSAAPQQSVPMGQAVYSSRMTPQSADQQLFVPGEEGIGISADRFVQYKGKYIVVVVKAGIMFIDQHRAHERIQYEAISKHIAKENNLSQQLIFPEIMALSGEDACIVEEMTEELKRAGMDVEYDAEKGKLNIKAIPSQIEAAEVAGFIEALIYDVTNGEVDIHGNLMDHICRTLASKSAVSYGKTLTPEEMASLYERLFACKSPSLTPGGKVVFSIVENEEIECRF
ncbi:MAG: DNA mismatch repair endonuclease MutL [Bacteroidales bacterium]|nr:DNA mismatch repair endonuclease MutL [Bacteroidales bacterium]